MDRVVFAQSVVNNCRNNTFTINWRGVIFLFVSLVLLFSIQQMAKHVFINETSNANNKFPAKRRLTLLASKLAKFRWCPKRNKAIININCDLLFTGDQEALNETVNWTSPCSYSDKTMKKISSNCDKLKQEFPFWSQVFQTPNKTMDYPLAFVIIGAKNSEQIVRLLQSIYSNRNVYCVTYDNKTSDDFKQTLRNLDKCYKNIIMPDNFVDIHWAGFSILQTAMFCLKSLAQTKFTWRYVQILSWNDFPLRTNEEFVKIMKIFNGSQDSLLDENSASRSRKYYNVNKYSTIMNHHLEPEKIDDIKPIPPGDLIEFKGSLATTMSREFVDFMFTNKIAREFYDWVNSTYCPEEIYWSTLIHNLHINPPGGFPGTCWASYNIQAPLVTYLSRYQIWSNDLDSTLSSEPCGGIETSYSCVYGVSNLKLLRTRPEFIAHKLYLEVQPATYYCLAQLHFNKTFFPQNYDNLDESFYENLPRVKYQQLADKEQFDCY